MVKYTAHLGGQVIRRLCFSLAELLSLDWVWLFLRLIVWNPTWRKKTKNPVSVVLFFWQRSFEGILLFLFCMIALKMMRLKVEHSHLYVNLEFGRQFFWIEDVFFCFQVHPRCPKLGVGWWDVVHFPPDKLRDGLKVKQAMLPPKQDITVLVKTPSNLQPANTMKACSSQTFHHRQYCPSCFVSIATAALNLALPSPNKYKVAKLVENRCPWTVCQSHFCYTALFLFITLHQQFLSEHDRISVRGVTSSGKLFN